MSASAARKPRLSLSSRILIGLAAGIACGLFFGEYVGWLKIGGEAFVGLLQMTVLPYIVVALITNLGRLEAGTGGRLLARGAAVLSALWAIGLTIILLVPTALPAFETASFFSTTMVDAPASIDFLELFIPENVFGSLARYAVPAVVLFCISLGLALIGLDPERRERLLDPLSVLGDGLGRVNSFVVSLTPWGVFAIAASLAGTMTVADLERIEAYLLVYTATCLILTFFVLPGLVAALTPFSARQVLAVSKDALVTAFATGKVLVVLPMLMERTRELFRELEGEDSDAGAAVEVLYPVAYPFPHLGKLVALVFVPFAAWFVGRTLGAAEYAMLMFAGPLVSFGGPIVSVSFFLDTLHLPIDLLQLFFAAGPYTSRVGDLLGTMHLVALVLVVCCWRFGLLRVRPHALALVAAGSVVLVLATIGGLRGFLGWRLAGSYDKDRVLLAMTRFEDALYAPQPVDVAVLERAEPNPWPRRAGQSWMDRIHERGVLRVGYRPDAFPWSFQNSAGELVGYEVDMARVFAADLDVTLELCPIDLEKIIEQFDEDHFDVAMAGLPFTPEFAQRLRLCGSSALQAHLAFVTRDHRTGEFSTLAEIRAEPLRIAAPGLDFFLARMRAVFPQAEIVSLSSPRDFFDAPEGEFDALLSTMETGSAWTLLYPSFGVVKPRDLNVRVSKTYPVHLEAEDLARVLSAWFEIKQQSGATRALYDYWILGRPTERPEPRWSVVRNVLGWVD